MGTEEPRRVATQELIDCLSVAQALVIGNLANALAKLTGLDPNALAATIQTLEPQHDNPLAEALAARMQRHAVLALIGSQPPVGQG